MIFGGVGDILGKVNQMKQNLKEVQEELANTICEENSGGVKVVVSGDMELKEFHIDPKVIESGDTKRIEWLVSDAVDKAYTKAKNEAMGKFKKLTGGMAIPGLF
jgi:nucleoid-associated protein EbfC